VRLPGEAASDLEEPVARTWDASPPRPSPRSRPISSSFPASRRDGIHGAGDDLDSLLTVSRMIASDRAHWPRPFQRGWLSRMKGEAGAGVGGVDGVAVPVDAYHYIADNCTHLAVMTRRDGQFRCMRTYAAPERYNRCSMMADDSTCRTVRDHYVTMR
jgi:hypothetical protein